MIKQIEIHGQRVKLYSADKGHTWSSSSQSVVAYGQRKQMLGSELQQRFEQMDAMQDRDPENFTQIETSQKSQKGRGAKL
jgi:hypothetical protein